MTRNQTLAGCLLWVCLPSLMLQAALGHALPEAYSVIPTRNVFRLREPEPTAADLPSQALATVRLTGITTLFAHKLAFLKVKLPAGPSEPAQELALSLEEGQRERNIEVLSIDEKAGRVELLNFGTRMVATFEAEPSSPSGAPKPAVHPPLLRVSARIPNP